MAGRVTQWFPSNPDQTQAEAAAAYTQHPVLLRVRELETLARLATNAEARLYIGFDKHVEPEPAQPE